MAKKGSGTGLQLTFDGYLRITRRGPLRNKMAHRAYVERQLGRELRPDEEVHHSCGNKSCWPPTDGHLIVMCGALHDACDSGKTPHRKRRAKDSAGMKVMEFLREVEEVKNAGSITNTQA